MPFFPYPVKRRFAAQAHAWLAKRKHGQMGGPPAAPKGGGKRNRDRVHRGGNNQMASKGKGNSKGKPVDRWQAQGLDMKTPDGKRICYDFHRVGGCPLVKAGEECYRGMHVYPKCVRPFSLQSAHEFC